MTGKLTVDTWIKLKLSQMKGNFYCKHVDQTSAKSNERKVESRYLDLDKKECLSDSFSAPFLYTLRAFCTSFWTHLKLSFLL